MRCSMIDIIISKSIIEPSETTEKVKTSVILRQRRRIFSFIYRIFRYAQNDKYRNFGLFQWFRTVPLIDVIDFTIECLM